MTTIQTTEERINEMLFNLQQAVGVTGFNADEGGNPRRRTIVLAAIMAEITHEQNMHLSDLSRAVGVLEGLGHPDPYLIQRRDKMLATLTATNKDEIPPN